MTGTSPDSSCHINLKDMGDRNDVYDCLQNTVMAANTARPYVFNLTWAPIERLKRIMWTHPDISLGDSDFKINNPRLEGSTMHYILPQNLKLQDKGRIKCRCTQRILEKKVAAPARLQLPSAHPTASNKKVKKIEK